MEQQTSDHGHLVTKAIWTAKFEENARRLLTALGYVKHEHTVIDSVTLYSPLGKKVFRPEPGKYICMAYIEYCHHIIPGFYLLDGERLLHDIKKDAALFFAERWHEGHGGFVAALIRATDINVKLKPQG